MGIEAELSEFAVEINFLRNQEAVLYGSDMVRAEDLIGDILNCVESYEKGKCERVLGKGYLVFVEEDDVVLIGCGKYRPDEAVKKIEENPEVIYKKDVLQYFIRLEDVKKYMKSTQAR